MLMLVRPLAAVATLALVTSCDQAPAPDAPKYSAEITFTDFGIPHIVADDYGSLGYGEGYVAAGDHLCNISHIVLRAKGELARTFGPGDGNANLLSDYAVHGLGMPARYEVGYSGQAQFIQDMLEGYAAGFNKYLAEYQAGDGGQHWCDGAEWVQPITGSDIFARARYITETLPRLGGALYAAQPPAEQSSMSAVPDAAMHASVEALNFGGFGSNAWAFGSEMTETGGGMLLGNPHYPWFGSNRFWEKHLTIPGKVDIYGVSLVGTPGVQIGFNKDIGWSHTVSNSQRLVIYQLTMSETNPLSYSYEGEEKPLEVRTFTIPVKQADGSLTDMPATMYHSHHGPLVALPGMGWADGKAYAVRDANRDNDLTYVQWMEMGLADSMDSFKAAHEKSNALPWVNTIATSRDGQAAYIDNSTVGNLSDEAIATWRAAYDAIPAIKQAYDRSRLVILDGSKTMNEFVDDGAPVTGTVPYAKRPQITRRDYVFNSNDSYWLSSPREPMTGFSPLYGPTDTSRTPRTRMNITHLEDGGARGADGKWSLAEIQNRVLSNESLTADILLPDLLTLCETEEVNAGACAVLADYNGELNVGSPGAVLFREWVFAYYGLATQSGSPLFAVPFDASDPVGTPSGLGSQALAMQALETAIELLNQAEIPLDATLGSVQVAVRGDTRVPMHGGFSLEGVANLIDQRPNDTIGPFPVGAKYKAGSNLSDKGYLVSGGTSFVYTLAYGGDGPVAEAFLTYGQSGEPTDENYIDQTRLFSAKQWRPIYFKRADVEANAKGTIKVQGD